jgi:D-alanyl-D-alanine carboxypeptidase/D-alanyl-D-alanine-endopeptidase (penicillin-binding protein 4)
VGAVVADLWLVGGGDALLATPEYEAFLAASPRWHELPPTSLAALADGVVAAGVREVTGRVRGDDTRHHPLRYLPSWAPRFIDDGDITPMSALSVNEGLATWGADRTPVAEPAVHAAAELTRLLRDRGVVVAGEADAAPSPSGAATVAEVASAPLRDVLAGMLRASDNVVAETIVRELGLRVRGEGSTAAGVEAVERSLSALGLDAGGVTLADGSGLSGDNLATCAALAGVLDARPGGVALADLLAVAGRSGTLRTRFVGTPFEATLRAKTGWVSGTVGIAGTVNGVTFAVLQNGVPTLQAGRAAEERVLGLVAGGA